MTKHLFPHPIGGTVQAIASKSMAHRLMICAALAKEPTRIVCHSTSNDIEATAHCLAAMQTGTKPLPCGESGSTLRFLLPVVAALGLETEFFMEGRLPQRPLAPLDAQLEAHGARLEKDGATLRVAGQLTPGDYTLPGDVSSQYISGLLFALPLLDAPSTLTVTGKVESAPYIAMTLNALAQFGIDIEKKDNVYHIPACGYRSPGEAVVEGDWSNAAFWLAAGAISEPVTVTGLDPESLQGDKAMFALMERFGAVCQAEADAFTVCPGTLQGIEIDAAAIPDLVPILSVVAAKAEGDTKIYNAQRLRLKESDRIETVLQLLKNLGADAHETEDGLVIHGGKPLTGGSVDSCGDHRIAMAGAIASCLCTAAVTITGAEAVNKSYPTFWEDFETLIG